ncbi:MAG: sugar-binding transcriptional regulator [Proteobacteria bacterium]|nr:sugar-binding transcriptional regulator [Pseudomonadota bacterium]
MATKNDMESQRLDDAARAGWLYYVAGNTQDEIAIKLGVSRQSAQRLVSLATKSRLIKVRLDHPIARCMELAHRLTEKYGLLNCEIVPSDPGAPDSTLGLSQSGAGYIEQQLRAKEPKILTFGTGRVLRACVAQISTMDCPQHRIVSLVGNMMPDGSASAYNVINRLADKVKAVHYPMPLPVIASSIEELKMLHEQKPIKSNLELARRADAAFVGIGHLGDHAPMYEDGFLDASDVESLLRAGAVGEIVGWVFDEKGSILKHPLNARVASAPLTINPENPVFGLAAGQSKIAAIRGAMLGNLINSLITNEYTAERLLQS